MDIPVLFLIFNRSDTALRVIRAIKQVKPSRIYIAADGPREFKEDEAKLCKETREMVMKEINWNCEVKTLFREKNLGCAVGVSSAINWFFDQEEMGIILEDDCLPSESFFFFCQELLHYYKEDDRIMHISGFNEQNGIKRGNASYYFSYYPSIWGWATWKRAWKHYQFKVKSIDDHLERGIIQTYFYGLETVGKRWFKDFRRCLFNTSAWGYQWPFSIWKQHGLSITPNQPLIKNIGFDGRGTHTNFKPAKHILDLELQPMEEKISHPEVLLPNQEADILTFRNQHYPKLGKRAKLKLQSVLKSIAG